MIQGALILGACQPVPVRLRIGPNLMLALAGLLAATVMVSWVAVAGLGAVNARTKRLYRHNILTTQATAELRAKLDDAAETALQLLLFERDADRVELEASLRSQLLPAVDERIEALRQSYAAEPDVEPAELDRLSDGWADFKRLVRTGLDPQDEAHEQAMTRQAVAIIDPITTAGLRDLRVAPGRRLLRAAAGQRRGHRVDPGQPPRPARRRGPPAHPGVGHQAAPVLPNLRNLALAEIRAATDALTGLANNRAVQDTIKRMVAQASRSVSPLSAALLDLDHFKRINDAYGHSRGDEVLLLLPDTGRDQAVVVAEKVREAVASLGLSEIAQPVTASLGIAAIPDDAGDADTLIRAADRALYAAKANGRNRVELFISPARSARTPA